jgi:hypothetical protein
MKKPLGFDFLYSGRGILGMGKAMEAIPCPVFDLKPARG